MKSEKLSKRVLDLMKKKDITYAELSERSGIPSSSLQRYFAGDTKKIPINAVEAIAPVFGVTPAYLMGWEDDDTPDLSEILIPIEKRNIPVIGTMSCGEPVYQENDFPSYVVVGNEIKADAAVIAKGDSMINARINDGDIVFLRYQPTVENGEIAGLWVDDGFQLKRVYQYGKTLVLRSENPKYPEKTYTEDDGVNIKILGKAVAFQSDVE